MASDSLTSSLLAVVAVLGALAALPWLLKRWQQRQQATRSATGAAQAQVLASVAVGPQQRVVMVQVEHGGQQACLVLGVTPQHMQCLHVLGQPAATLPAGAAGPVGAPVPATFASAIAHLQSDAGTSSQS